MVEPIAKYTLQWADVEIVAEKMGYPVKGWARKQKEILPHILQKALESYIDDFEMICEIAIEQTLAE